MMQEEIFGPVFVLHQFGNDSFSSQSDKGYDQDELLRMLNDVKYGLSAVLFTEDNKFAHEFAKKIEAGSVFINHPSASLSEFSFGGVKKSGFGRECGPLGMASFGEVKGINLNGCSKNLKL